MLFARASSDDDRKPTRHPRLNGYNFTERVRRALTTAREEAGRYHHEYVGTEHILLGLIREEDGVAASVLDAFDLDRDEVRRMVEAAVTKGKPQREARLDVPYTSRGKKVLELAMTEARELNHDYVGVEHLLLGLLREEKGIGAQVMKSVGVTLEPARAEVLRLLGSPVQPVALAIEIDDTSSHSIYEQIIQQIQEAIATKRLAPNDRLPTVRQLADRLDIAPGTVARAYSELERLGVVVTDGARGTRVAEHGAAAIQSTERFNALVGLLRPIAVDAFHKGASAAELRRALKVAIDGIFT